MGEMKLCTKNRLSMFYAERLYNNYNFYFLKVFSNGYKNVEIKKIHIYEGSKILFTMNKPWFKDVSALYFNDRVEEKRKISFNGNVFYTTSSNYKDGELYIPNYIAMFEKIQTKVGVGIYEKVDVYKSRNELLNFHIEDIGGELNYDLITKIQTNSNYTKSGRYGFRVNKI